MLCWRNCLVQGRVLVHACLYDGIFCYLFGFTERHFLVDCMIYLRVGIVEDHSHEFLLTFTYLIGSHACFVHLFIW